MPSAPDSVIACSLTAEAVPERIQKWRDVLGGATPAPLASGVRLIVPIERAADIVTLAAAEQACCPFFDFRIHLGGPVLHLEVRVPAAASEMLAEIFAPAP